MMFLKNNSKIQDQSLTLILSKKV